jgi:hypothetical protein
MEILIPISFFAMIAALSLGPRYFTHLERQKMQEVLRAAYDAGQPVNPDIIVSLMATPPKVRSPLRDIRSGAILLATAVGIGFLARAIAYDSQDAYYPLIGVAAIPGAIGIAYLILGLIAQFTAKPSTVAAQPVVAAAPRAPSDDPAV